MLNILYNYNYDIMVFLNINFLSAHAQVNDSRMRNRYVASGCHVTLLI